MPKAVSRSSAQPLQLPTGFDLCIRIGIRTGNSTLLTMASTRDIRRRIKSVRSTAQITKAMQMVAASKMRKAQQAALNGRPFARLLYRFQRRATTQAVDFTHPLLTVRD